MIVKAYSFQVFEKACILHSKSCMIAARWRSLQSVWFEVKQHCVIWLTVLDFLHISGCAVWNEWGGGPDVLWPPSAGCRSNWETLQWTHCPAYRPRGAPANRCGLPANTSARQRKERNSGEGEKHIDDLSDGSFVVYLKDQCEGFRRISRQKWIIIIVLMLSLVYNHLKLRTVLFVLPENESFISTEGAHPLPRSPPCFCSSHIDDGSYYRH